MSGAAPPDREAVRAALAGHTGAVFRAAFEDAALGMALCGPDGTYYLVNARMSALTGYTRAELEAGGGPLLWTPETRVASLVALRELWEGVRPSFGAERRFRRADGSELWVHVAAGCVLDGAGEPLCVLAQYQDITARMSAQHKLRAATEALQQSQLRYQTVLDRIGEVVFQVDHAGCWTFLNEAWTAITGHSVEESLGRPYWDIVYAGDRTRHARAFAPLRRGDVDRVRVEHRYVMADGRVRWAEVEAYGVPEGGGQVSVTGVIRDVTERRHAEREANAHTESLLAVAKAARVLPTGGDARTAICEAACAVSGAAFAALIEPRGDRLVSTAMAGMAFEDIVLPTDPGKSAVAMAFATREPLFVADAASHPAVSQAMRRRLDTESLLYQPVFGGDELIAMLCLSWCERVAVLSEGQGAVIGLLAAEAAVAIERADMVLRLEGLARTDALTGLANRRTWDEGIGREMARCRRQGTALCVALLDLDHFKALNDRRGHQAGDRLLKDAAAAWQSSLREVDLIARWGGEEFAVALPDCGLADGLAIVDRLRSSLPGPTTCSAGVAAWDGREQPAELLGRADSALYRAKADGRDRTAVAEPPAAARRAV